MAKVRCPWSGVRSNAYRSEVSASGAANHGDEDPHVGFLGDRAGEFGWSTLAGGQLTEPKPACRDAVFGDGLGRSVLGREPARDDHFVGLKLGIGHAPALVEM